MDIGLTGQHNMKPSRDVLVIDLLQNSLYDESGVMCYTYGNMGEVTQETRIYALPFLTNALALSTQFTYDSWGRILNITYPDNEVVNYAYDLGGQLQSITNNSSYTYLDNVTYDRFGAKVSQTYGNGLVTNYNYNNLTRRLSNIATMNGNSQVSSFAYTYDNVGNVTQVTSSCSWLTNQSFTESFTYDASDQLTTASETQNRSYTLSVSYDNWGKMENYDILYTDLLNSTTTQDNRTFSYPAANSLQDAQTLFAPEQCTGTTDVAFTFGINGSLRKREVSNPQPYIEYYLFNSAANMKAYSNNGLDFAYYGYNAANTRAYKLSMLNQNQRVNGQPEPLSLQLQQAMFYPNAYLNFNHNGEYTKHYYNGTERIASRLGENTVSIAANNNDRFGFRIMQADQQSSADLLELVEAGDVPIETPSVDVSALQTTGSTTDIFYYHMNHLGSTAFVTDQNQTVTQGFLYAPFGEITTEYNATFGNDIIPKYSFNAKELDEETGMYYYEARYYKPPVFTSRDAMMDQKPWLNPYHYCSNNPVGRVDPSGMLDDDYFNENGKYLGSDNATSDNVRIISQINWDKLKSIDADGKESIDHEIGNTISFSFSEASNSGMPEEAQLNVYQHYNPTKETLKVHPDDNQKIMGMTTVVASNNKIIAIQIRLKGNSSGIKIADHANEIRCFFSHEEAHVKMFYKLKYKKYAKTPVEEREEYAIRAEMNSEYWNKVRQEYRNATLQYAKKFGIIF